ncbi:IucA/IucC family C-terminal-domain containing protein [Bacillus sp. S/N-304-OC-R1]|uniref:IucA/IucC family C-terminal-domain containing protein n=1 Tax=Bacillus sp. S/N-304-OC-R1 TaxID=2758034 RepID=UPI001C8E9CB2|nr:IucA/IucC family C-terminal-domain containing protein [Bacillus sp. S/N-304-OC-R1]MBY0124191.1 (2Fe-2S)-binding protein [Bacillus sp. S/N-304-OC-R1]
MVQWLSEAQINELRSYRFTTEKSNSALSISLEMLLKEQNLRDYLDKLSQHIDAANEKVTASIFIKRYAFLAVNYLYAMTVWNKKLDISFENVTLETDDHDELWLPSFYFNEKSAEKAYNEDRNAWRKNCVKMLFSDHLFPLIKNLSSVTKVSKLILWENIAVYIYWLYETILSKEKLPEEVILRAKEDFQYLVFQADGSLFGSLHDNPLKRYFNQHIYLEEFEREVRPRNTCCLSYLTKAKKRCNTCPHTCAACPLINEITRREEKTLEPRTEG